MMAGGEQQAEAGQDCPVCGLFFIDGWRYLAHLRGHRKRGARLAPLEPNRFLAWAWTGEQGTGPVTLDDVVYELQARDPATDAKEIRREYVHIAATVRRNQRLGLNPWEGI